MKERISERGSTEGGDSKDELAIETGGKEVGPPFLILTLFPGKITLGDGVY